MKIISVALIFNLFDFISGIMCAIKKRQINSSRLRDGLFKKVGFIFCYMLAFLIDNYSYLIGINLEFMTLPAVVGYVCLTEVISIVENICKINPDIMPEKLLSLLNIERKE